MEKEFKYYFSLVTGRIERIMADEVTILEVYQLPLLKKPRHNCKHCYGRGYESYDPLNVAYIPCRCVKKVIDKDVYSGKQISYYNPK